MTDHTAKELVIEYLKDRLKSSFNDYDTVFTHDIEVHLPRWAWEKRAIMHTPGTYSRRFRELRQGTLLQQHGLELQSIPREEGKVEKAWKLQHCRVS